MFQVEYNNSKEVLFINFVDGVGVYELLSCIRSIGENNSLPKDVCVLQDFSDAVFCFEPAEIALIHDELVRFAVKNETVKIASVYSNPRETAYGQLMACNTSIKNYQHVVFQSRTEALKWLNPVAIKA